MLPNHEKRRDCHLPRHHTSHTAILPGNSDASVSTPPKTRPHGSECPHLRGLTHNLTPHAHRHSFRFAISDYTSSFEISNSKMLLSDRATTF